MKSKLDSKVSTRFLCFVITLFGLSSCVVSHKGDIVQDIFTLEKPVGFEGVNIRSVLRNYIDIGMSERELFELLEQEGWKLAKEEDFDLSYRTIANETTVSIWTISPYAGFSRLPEYRIIVTIETVDSLVSSYSGVFFEIQY